ncbi:MAG: glucose 1-dehydrogenase [Pirellulaceae bacterium]|jgi:glucose 1-dehydrogenase
MIHLNGRTAFITGSTQGVGLAIALAMAEAGANIVLHGKNESEATPELFGQFEIFERKVGFVASDLLRATPTDQIAEQIFRETIDSNASIDILVNNAGSYLDKPFLEMDLQTLDNTMRLNVYAGYFLTQSFSKHWIANNIDGRVLMTGSINGRLAEQDHTAYDTSKGAVEMMVKSMCVSLAPYNIRVNGMAPGLVRTPLTAIVDQDDKFADWMCLHTPNGKVPTAEVCGGAAVFLCSDAASHVHGQMLLVDGGMSAWQQPDPPHLK